MNAPATKTPSATKSAPRFLIVLLLVAGVYFVLRGVVPACNNSQDLTVGYTAARTWTRGLNPYESAVLTEELARSGGADLAAAGMMRALLNIYFPTTVPMFLPLAWADWPTARILWLGANIAGVLFITGGLAHLLRWRWSSPQALGLLLALLALAPVQSTMKLGQTGILATALVVAAAISERQGRPVAGGLFYGLTTALKVQIGLPFIAYLLWRRRWRTAAVALAVVVGMTVLSVARMESAAVPWRTSWLANLDSSTSGGELNDASRSNPNRHSLLNLQYPLHTLIDSRLTVNLITFACVGAAALLLVSFVRGRGPTVERELLTLSVVAVLALLVTYHRTYDAVLLAFPIAWAISALRASRHWLAIVVLVFSTDFLLPMQTMLYVLYQQGHVPEWLATGWRWELGLLAQQVWALVGMAAALLWVVRPRRIKELGLEH